MNPANSVVVRVNGFDSDCPLIGLCSDPIPIKDPNLTNGSNGAGEWAVAVGTLDVKSMITFDPPEVAVRHFTLNGDNGSLKFRVFGRAALLYPF